MRIGASAGLYHDRLDGLPPAFEFVELSIGEGERPVDEIDINELRECLTDAGLGLAVHLPYRQPLATSVPVVDSATATYLTELLDVAAAGAEQAVAHPRTRSVDPTSATVVDRLSALATAGRERDVTVCFETTGYAGGPALEHVGDLAVRADAAVCLDLGYAYLEAGTDGVESFLASYADVVEHLHVHGVRHRNDTHIPIGSGHLPLGDLGPTLAETVGETTTTIEVFTDDATHLEDSRRRVRSAVGP